MNERVTIRLAKQNMKISAGHFTIFSATERERLHGHNFTVEVDIEARMLGNGMCFDYGHYKDRVVALCRELNEWVILPTRSPHLRIEEGPGLVDQLGGLPVVGVGLVDQQPGGLDQSSQLRPGSVERLEHPAQQILQPGVADAGGDR